MCLAIPGQVLTITGDDELTRTARVSFGGAVKEIGLAYTPEAQVGDYVLAHAGFALGVIDPAEAERVFAEIRAMQAAEAEEDQERGVKPSASS